MSEYWISQGRRMCTYCKCWTADNKASINFHEQGKNHKENVKRKLDELRKKGVEDARKKDQERSDLAMIEKAALASLQKDLASNPSWASAYGVSPTSEIVQSSPAKDAAVKPRSSCFSRTVKGSPSGAHDRPSRLNKPVYLEEDHNQSSAKLHQEHNQSAVEEHSGEWLEAVTEEGHIYYWNTVTAETSWYPPGFTASEVGVSELVSSDQASTTSEHETSSGGASEETTAVERSTKLAKEPVTTPTTLTEPRVSEPRVSEPPVSEPPVSEPPVSETPVSETPVNKSPASGVTETTSTTCKVADNRKRPFSAYGDWQVIREESVVDLQLPSDSTNYEVDTDDIPLPQTSEFLKPEAEKVHRFKEKVVSLNTKPGGSGEVAFKKRKFGSARQNSRKAVDQEN